MKRYRYQVPGEDLSIITKEVSEQDILNQWWEYWSGVMTKLGRHEHISEENCIADYVTVHWAEEVKD